MELTSAAVVLVVSQFFWFFATFGVVVSIRIEVWVGPALDLRLQALDVGDPVPAHAAVQARTRDVWVDEVMEHRQQVVQGQQQRASQLDGQQFLGRVERGGKLVRPVRAVLGVPPALPLARDG